MDSARGCDKGGGAEDISVLLDKLYNDKGWDFRDYKKTSLNRRVSKRLSVLNITTYKEYCEALDRDPAEWGRLFSTITIKVGEFFREPEVYDVLGGAIGTFFPAAEPIKAWCCACAYGEEAYSLAMLLAERLSADALKDTKVFATDIDSEAIEQARRATYRDESLNNVSPALMDKYFFATGGYHKVKYNIRNIVKFGVLDVVRDPVISGVHMLFCRNLFIYLNKTLQDSVLKKLDYALRPGGMLVLGRAEVIPQSYAGRYTRIIDRVNVYRKRG